MPIITIVDYSLVEKKEKVSGLPDPGNEKLLKSVQLLHLQTMRLGVLKPYRKSTESKHPTMCVRAKMVLFCKSAWHCRCCKEVQL